MRLISLVLALVILASIIIYYKTSLVPVERPPQQTVKEQARQIIDDAKDAAGDLQKQMEEQQKRLEQFDK